MQRIVVTGPQDAVDPLARALRDAGHEVVHAGADPTPEQLVATALQEDADVVVLAAPDAGAGAVDRLARMLAAQDAADVAVLTGSPAEVVARV